eukprot:878049-Rhodomonas_salina.1
MGQKPWPDRRRTLAYIRNEARFYQEFAEVLCPLPHFHVQSTSASSSLRAESTSHGETRASFARARGADASHGADRCALIENRVDALLGDAQLSGTLCYRPARAGGGTNVEYGPPLFQILFPKSNPLERCAVLAAWCCFWRQQKSTVSCDALVPVMLSLCTKRAGASALAALQGLTGMHAAAWEDQALLR